MSFLENIIHENPTSWGPTSSSLFLLKEIPSYYSPYNKGEKLGKAADWITPQHNTKQTRSNFGRGDSQQSHNMFGYTQEDESDFVVVEGVTKGPKQGSKRFTRGGFQQRQPASLSTQQTNKAKGYVASKQRTRGGGAPTRAGQRWGETITVRKREYSVEIREDWELKENIEFSALNKLDDGLPQDPTTLKECGDVKYYDSTFDNLTAHKNKALVASGYNFHTPTTMDDSVLRELYLENSHSGNFVVLGTDIIFSHLMACTRSVIPWDLVVTKTNNKLSFDIRGGSHFERVSVNENILESSNEEKTTLSTNSPYALAKEATQINYDFSQQVLLKNGIVYDDQIPFAGEDQPNIAYHYKKWDLGDGNIMIVRCEVNAINKDDNPMLIKAVNEYDPKITGDWRKKIDSQRAVLLASDAKSNVFKYTKWAAQARLAEITSLKLGFVTRGSPRDYQNHVVLAIGDYDIKEYIGQTNIPFDERNLWAILKHIIKLFKKHPDGKYVLLRDNEKPLLRVYSIPEDAFEVKEEAQKEEEP